MSLPSQVASYWIRARMKRKPAGEQQLALHARQVMKTPDFLVWFHSRQMHIRETSDPVEGEWLSLREDQESPRVIYYLHGGGYVSGSPKTYRPITATLARSLSARTFALEYRLAPENPFPAALEDAVAGYQWLVTSGIAPGFISVVGDSAGGGLALALMMKLRDLGERLPSSAVCMSPWTDMAGTGESVVANEARDPLFCAEDVERFARLYLGEQSRVGPFASPLYGDFRGLPPLLIHVGENEMLLDDARRAHARALSAGAQSTLRIFRDVPHVWQLLTPFVPEASVSLAQIAKFVSNHWAGAGEISDAPSHLEKYSTGMSLLEARRLFFARSGLGNDGGYGARWVRVESRPVPFYFPNTHCRVEAAKLHDLHHVATEYETDWPGEAEIAGWEIASGCGRHGWAWLLNLGAFAVGMVMFPKRLFRAFVRGRRARNLYREGFPEAQLPEVTVEWLRARVGIMKEPPPINGADRAAFAFWCLVAFAYHAALPVAGLIVLLKLL